MSEMTWSKRKQHPSKLVKVGDDVDVIVLGVDSQRERRISLRHGEAGAIRSVASARGEISGGHGGKQEKFATSPSSALSSKSRKDSTA